MYRARKRRGPGASIWHFDSDSHLIGQIEYLAWINVETRESYRSGNAITRFPC